MSVQRQIIHVAMDAFFASVEQRDNPQLKGKPVLVGGSPQARGVISAASYEARPFGVHSAMPTSRALRLCPHAILLPVRMDRYLECSHQIHDIFCRFTDRIEPVYIDEAFLDVTDCLRLLGPAEQIGRRIQSAIRDELQLTASLGLAPNKFLAKIASDLQKPAGFVVITEENKQAVLDPLPVSKIWGVGKVTAGALESRGIRLIRDLRPTPLPQLQALLGNAAPDLLDLAQGVDARPVETESQAKSLSSETTFPEDLRDPAALLPVLLAQVEEVAQRLRRKNLLAGSITLKFRCADFRLVTRGKTLPEPTATTQTLWQYAKELFQTWHRQSAAPLRLIGFAAAGLTGKNQGQLLLFPDPDEEKQAKLDQAIDAIQKHFGPDSLRRGGI